MKEAYYKLAVWVERFCCFQDGKQGYATMEAAKVAARTAGKYRISLVEERGRTDYEPFEVKVNAPALKTPEPARNTTPGGKPNIATRPMGGRPH